MENGSNGVRLLVEEIAKALVDTPGGVVVNEVAGEHATVFELRVAEGDLGKVIGKQGRTARCNPHFAGCRGYQAESPLFAGNSGIAG